MANQYSPPNLPVAIEGVHGYIDGDGTVMLKLRDCVIGLGLTEVRVQNGVEYTKVRWARVRDYLRQIKFAPVVAQSDDGAAATNDWLKECFIPEPYFYLLAMKADSEIARAFREKVAFKILPEIRRTGTYTVPSHEPTPAPVRTSKLTVAIDDMGAIAGQIEGIFGAERGIALSKAMTLVEQEHGVNLDTLRDLLPPAEGDVGKLTPTEIGKLVFNQSARRINETLARLGLQERLGDGWQLTTAGREYGEMIPYTRNGHTGYRPLWKMAIVDVIKGGDEGV